MPAGSLRLVNGKPAPRHCAWSSWSGPTGTWWGGAGTWWGATGGHRGRAVGSLLAGDTNRKLRRFAAIAAAALRLLFAGCWGGLLTAIILDTPGPGTYYVACVHAALLPS